MEARGIIPRSELGRLAFESLPGVSVLVFDPDLRITGCCGSVREAHGSDPEDLLGRLLVDVLWPQSYRRVAHNCRAALRGQTTIFDVRSQRSVDQIFELRTAPLRDDRGDVIGVIAVSRDVTAERTAQITLRDCERRYRLLVDESTDVISRQTADGTYLWVSPSVEKLLARTPSELVGRSIEEFLHPDDRDSLRRRLTILVEGSDDLRHTYRMQHQEGRWLWVETVLRGLRDPRTGEVVEIIGAGRDVTAHVLAENALARSNADLGQFAATASHDLSEPLLLMRAYADLLADEAADRLTAADLNRLEVISRNATRMQTLIDTLLTYAAVDRKTVGHERVDMTRVVDDTLALLEARIVATGATVRRGPLVPVTGDARLLGALLQNLLSNAMKFCDRPPVIDISCERAPEGWVLVVSDNGIGIPAEEMRRIFGMFARVEGARYPGLGLGLATSQRIAEIHGGTIEVESEVGVGSTFKVVLTTKRG